MAGVSRTDLWAAWPWVVSARYLAKQYPSVVLPYESSKLYRPPPRHPAHVHVCGEHVLVLLLLLLLLLIIIIIIRLLLIIMIILILMHIMIILILTLMMTILTTNTNTNGNRNNNDNDNDNNNVLVLASPASGVLLQRLASSVRGPCVSQTDILWYSRVYYIIVYYIMLYRTVTIFSMY